jgi:hypothetical protein
MRPYSVFSASFLVLVTCSLYAATINVPADQPTIQDAINVANTGDLVLVAAGTYAENIDFKGKAITVRSASGAKVTIIDGGKRGSVVTFSTDEGQHSILDGFTLQHGNANLAGGGIIVATASPTIENNIIQYNTACVSGGGIYLEGSARLLNNVIQNNSQNRCSGGGYGGGVDIAGGSPVVYGNVIRNNRFSGLGAGVASRNLATPILENNIITQNSGGAHGVGGSGGGLAVSDGSSPRIVQNLFAGNTANDGGGTMYVTLQGGRGPLLVNNTIVGAGATQSSTVWIGGYDSHVVFYNNLLIGSPGQNAVDCDATFNTSPLFTNNDAYSANGSGLSGACASQSNQNGNISADPIFVSTMNFELRSASPAINAGDNSAPDIPAKDLAGKTRIVGGTVDMGAYEFQ